MTTREKEMEKHFITKHAANIMFSVVGGVRDDNDSLTIDIDCIGKMDVTVHDGTKKHCRSIRLTKETFLKMKEFMIEAEAFLNEEARRAGK
jgi:hypothetical protein